MSEMIDETAAIVRLHAAGYRTDSDSENGLLCVQTKHCEHVMSLHVHRGQVRVDSVATLEFKSRTLAK